MPADVYISSTCHLHIPSCHFINLRAIPEDPDLRTYLNHRQTTGIMGHQEVLTVRGKENGHVKAFGPEWKEEFLFDPEWRNLNHGV